MLTKILTTIGGVSTLAFGIWHFFVPTQWNWYSYIMADATELVIAVRTINVFFSLSLVLFGIANIIFAFASHRFPNYRYTHAHQRTMGCALYHADHLSAGQHEYAIAVRYARRFYRYILMLLHITWPNNLFEKRIAKYLIIRQNKRLTLCNACYMFIVR